MLSRCVDRAVKKVCCAALRLPITLTATATTTQRITCNRYAQAAILALLQRMMAALGMPGALGKMQMASRGLQKSKYNQ